MISVLQLQYFQAVAQEGNLTRAAKKLFVSQTTLSAMLTKMESELGVQLFDRRNSRIYINDYGRAFLSHADVILSELDQAQKELRAMKDRTNSRLSIASSSEYVWQGMLITFSEQYPDYHITQHHDQLSRFVDELLEGHVDFVLTGEGDISSGKLDHITIHESSLCLCVAPSHPLADRAGIYLSELAQVPMVNLTHDTPFQSFVDSLFEAAGIAPPSAAECGYMMRPHFTSKGYGAAITNDDAVCREIFLNHKFIPILDDTSTRKIAMYWLKDREFTPAMALFFQFIQNYMKNI